MRFKKCTRSEIESSRNEKDKDVKHVEFLMAKQNFVT